MKTISLICAALALGVPALAAAQRADRAGSAVAVQRVDTGRALTPARDFEIRRGDAVRGETGTRIARRRYEPNRRRPHNPARRRYYNATH